MTRRRRRRIARPKPPNPWVILGQILMLIVFLVAVIAITDTVSDGTSGLVEALTSEDIEVGASPADEDIGDLPDSPAEETRENDVGLDKTEAGSTIEEFENREFDVVVPPKEESLNP